jgi:hypothetical protein
MPGRMKPIGLNTYAGVRLADLNQRLTADTVIQTSKAFVNALAFLKGDCESHKVLRHSDVNPNESQPTLFELNGLLKDSAMIPVRRKWYSLRTGVRFGHPKEPMYTLSEARIGIEELGPFFEGASS